MALVPPVAALDRESEEGGGRHWYDKSLDALRLLRDDRRMALLVRIASLHTTLRAMRIVEDRKGESFLVCRRCST